MKTQPLTELHNERELLISNIINATTSNKKAIHYKILEDYDRDNRTFTKLQTGEALIGTYKGLDITEMTGNVIQVLNHDKQTRFIVGLDDSKTCGYRKIVRVTIHDAINYIDWTTRNK